MLHTLFKFLGPSPDGLVYDASADEKFGLLEVKCPYRPFTERFTLENACKQPSFCWELLGGVVRLKRQHTSFKFNVSLPCNALWGDFGLWFRQSVHVQRINFDNVFG